MKCTKICLPLLVMVGILSGCATQAPNMFRSGRLHLNQTTTNNVRAIWLTAVERDSGIEVSGALKGYERTSKAIKVHVDVTVLAPDGETLAEAHSRNLLVSHNRIGRGSQCAKRFSVPIKLVPPAESVIQVVVHKAHGDKG